MAAKTQVTRKLHAVVNVEVDVADELAPPAWTVGLVATGSPAVQRDGDLTIDLTDGGDFALATARLRDAVTLDAPTLERRVTEVYDAIAARLHPLAANQLVRLWNHIPSIHQRMDARRDRYMVFNAGRFKAFENWYGGVRAFDHKVATASGVGHDGADLVVHCLASRAGGTAIDNPRQIAPHRYSTRFGPLPPCFARGTLLPGARLILVGGTASIRGEDSLHVQSLAMQMRETLTNLAAVVASAQGQSALDAGPVDERRWLALYRDLRVYHPKLTDRKPIEAMLQEAFSSSCRIELRRAELCRAELLVEIEGVAGLER
jgi:chorismate lyase/3-hydroxybenzoate synthase